MSKLTWQIDGGDDEISKRRRGEFPPQKKRPTKTKKCLDPSTIPYSTPTPESRTTVQNRDSTPRLLQARKLPVCVLDSDSEDELRILVAQELSRNQETVTTEDEGNLEVVGDDFVVKSSMFWSGGLASFPAQLGLKPPKNDEEYDSADTDEILTQNKNSSKSEDLSERETDSSYLISHKSSIKSRKIDGKKPAIKNAQKPTESESDNDAESSSESINSDYEAMVGNCHMLELSLADLENLAKNMDDEESNGDTQVGPSEMPKISSRDETGPQKARSKKRGINPEDILSSLFEPDMDKEEKKKNVRKSCLPAFIGTKDLFESTPIPTGLKRAAERESCKFGEESKRPRPDMKTLEDEESSSAQINMLNKKDTKVKADCSSNEMEMTQEPKKLISEPSSSLKVNNRTHSVPKHPTSLPQTKHSPRSSSSSDEEEEEQTFTLESKTSKAQERSASDSSGCTEESETGSDEEEKKSNKPEAASKPSSKQMNENTASGPKLFQQSVLDPMKQQQDNQKRLAAVEQRQKESEQQKKLIQCALSQVVSSQCTHWASFINLDII